MWSCLLILAAAMLATAGRAADEVPPAEAFQVFEKTASTGRRITPYLQYQTEQAWKQDDQRRAEWAGIQTEKDLLAVQDALRKKVLEMIGGLPAEKTDLRPRITGKLEMDGFTIEKLIFESLPGVYVSALVYLPSDRSKKSPAVLVPAGHAPSGKIYYQELCQRLAKRGYVVLAWDPVGQGERSQFWDAKAGKTRYNLICAEHAVMGNLAYLAGTNLARWEIWDGIRAVDYLLTRPEVDGERISIVGTSGGGFQAAQIAALDKRIKVVVPSCYITSLPMRIYNRIFADPDSDPEQDLFGMISNGVDHPGLLLQLYPRPVLVAAAVLDFFPIEGTHKTFREVQGLYERFHHGDRIALAEGYHAHQFSPENQEAAFEFLDRFNAMPIGHGLPETTKLDDKNLLCTASGQVMLEFKDGRSLMDVISDYFEQRKSKHTTIAKEYFANGYSEIKAWNLNAYKGGGSSTGAIHWELVGSTKFKDVLIDRYILHHSGPLEIPLLHIHKGTPGKRDILLWFQEDGKVKPENWPEIEKYVNAHLDIVSFDFRGLGETKMPYKAVSPDDPAMAQMTFEQAYTSPLSGVLAGYVYNSLLTGRPYFLQMIEDAEIATRFVRGTLDARVTTVTATGNGYFLAKTISETLPGIKLLPQPNDRDFSWATIVREKQEMWPIQYLLPGGAYIH
ncbi:MAG: acetylxylan esterase [Acidobacteriota bacterium]|nr:acetylxylan esterase [Acidobacteriota bacterium]